VIDALRGKGRPLMAASEIQRALGLGKDAGRGLRRLLQTLVKEGVVERIGRRYRLPRRDGLVEGHYSEEGERGGVVVADDGVAWRVPDGGEARPGDRVLVLPLGKQRGELLGVAEGGRDVWLGVLARERGRGPGWVTPYRDDGFWKVRVGARDLGEAADGDVVVVEPSKRRRQDGRPEGRVVEVLGPPGTPEADFRAVVWRRRLPVAFPAAVRAEAEALPEEIPAGERARRVDLRELPFVTIDPVDARDHDDAVCIDSTAGQGTRILVAIADVSWFVRPGSALDREALRRGNSVYFPDRAIPMLPERLASDLCSLREGVDRLAFVAELGVEGSGRVRRRGFFPAVIRSHASLSYEQAAAVMEGGEGGAPASLAPGLRELAEVTRAIGRRRMAAGSLDLEIPSARLVMGEDGMPLDAVTEERSVAHRTVEEAMLAANRAVAATLEAAGAPAVFRNHEAPSEEDLQDLRELLGRLGLLGKRAPVDLDAHTLVRALERAKGRRDAALAHRAVLRAMRLARYEAVCRGHYALAFEHYLHFTSPIRRYADLTVHRALGDLLEERRQTLAPEIPRRVAGRLSWLERRAEAAEREMVDIKKATLMRSRVGEEFDATVTGVARHGLYVTLDAPFVEALVHISRLPGYLHFDERAHALIASRGGSRFGIGDRLRVQIDAVDPIKAHINASLLETRRKRRN
jgi:ribonuclease R